MSAAAGLQGVVVSLETHWVHAGAVPKDDLGGDFLSSSGLVTSSEEYYPTVAINALMRALRDPAMSSHHSHVVRSLFEIFQSLQLAAVPFLPKASMPPPVRLSHGRLPHAVVDEVHSDWPRLILLQLWRAILKCCQVSGILLSRRAMQP